MDFGIAADDLSCYLNYVLILYIFLHLNGNQFNDSDYYGLVHNQTRIN